MKTYLSTALLGLFLVAAFTLPQNAQAQILEVKQTVFGMDCAPCAHGLQKRLGQIDGVTDVKVSLDDGFAELKFAPSNEVKLETIRNAVEESGFAAKDATVRVSGTLQQDNGQVVLVSTTGDRFLLEQSAEGAADYGRLKSAAAGEQVTVSGIIPEVEKSAQSRWVLQVLDAGRLEM